MGIFGTKTPPTPPMLATPPAEAISRLPIDMVIMETPIATLLSRDVLARIS